MARCATSSFALWPTAVADCVSSEGKCAGAAATQNVRYEVALVGRRLHSLEDRWHRSAGAE